MKHLILILSALVFSFSSQALEIDTAASSFKWTGTKVTGKHFGKLPIKSSKLTDVKGKLSGGEIVLDITKMTVNDLTGDYQKKFLTHMKSPDFFEVEKWPTAKLVVTKLDGKKAYGKLTIKDKTHPVDFAYQEKSGTYTGTLKFDRTKFGMIYGSGNFFKGLGDKMIHNDVTLEFTVKVKSPKKKVAQK